MLKKIYGDFRFDFSKDLELRIALLQFKKVIEELKKQGITYTPK